MGEGSFTKKVDTIQELQNLDNWVVTSRPRTSFVVSETGGIYKYDLSITNPDGNETIDYNNGDGGFERFTVLKDKQTEITAQQNFTGGLKQNGNDIPDLSGDNTFGGQQTIDTGNTEPAILLGTQNKGQSIDGLNADQIDGAELTSLGQLGQSNTWTANNDFQGGLQKNGNAVPDLATENTFEAAQNVPAVRSKDRPYVDVSHSDFGADPDDAGSDDTQAVLDAVDAASANGTIWLPRGTYSLSSWSDHTIDKNLTFACPGREAATIKGPGGVNFIDMDASIRLVNLTIEGFDSIIHGNSISSDIDLLRVDDCDLTADIPILSQMGAGVTLKRMLISNSTFNSTSYISQISTAFDHIHVRQTVADGGERGWQFGDNNHSRQDKWKKLNFAGSIVKNLSRSDGENQGLLFYGREFHVHHSFFSEITNTGGHDCEGVYVKGRYGSVNHCTFVNAGIDNGAIAEKGNQRGDTSAPQGFAVNIDHNLILFDDTSADTANSTGIYVQGDDVSVTHNLVEGARRAGFFSPGTQNRNVRLQGNQWLETRGFAALWAYSCDGLTVNGDLVDGVTNDAGGPVRAFLMQSRNEGLDNVTVKNLESRNLTPSDGTSDSKVFEVFADTADVGKTILELNDVGDATHWVEYRGGNAIGDSYLLFNHVGTYDTPIQETTAPSSLEVAQNVGYVTENNGNASVSDGDTIAHGLDETPTYVNLTASADQHIAVATAVDGTNITVGLHDDTGTSVTADETVYWEAKA